MADNTNHGGGLLLPDGRPAPMASDDVLRLLYQGGCGAWQGRSNCGDATTSFLTGQSTLRFQTHTGAWLGEQVPETQYMVALCDRHGGPEALKGRLLADMPGELQAQQMAACADWLASWGIGLELGGR